MNNMFHFCISLTHLPDISKRKINNDDNYEVMFMNCYQLRRPYYSYKLKDFIKVNAYTIY